MPPTMPPCAPAEAGNTSQGGKCYTRREVRKIISMLRSAAIRNPVSDIPLVMLQLPRFRRQRSYLLLHPQYAAHVHSIFAVFLFLILRRAPRVLCDWLRLRFQHAPAQISLVSSARPGNLYRETSFILHWHWPPHLKSAQASRHWSLVDFASRRSSIDRTCLNIRTSGRPLYIGRIFSKIVEKSS